MNSRFVGSTATRRSKRFSRRAAVVVQVAVMSTVIMGFGALAIDVGNMYTVRAEMQAAADAAALAAAAQLSGAGGGDVVALAHETADEFARRNRVDGGHHGLGNSDVELGQAVFDGVSGKFTFQPGGDSFDAVRVTYRRDANSEGGPLILTFANIFGISRTELTAQASAVLIPRDIAVVIDLSGSMNDDSELQHYRDYTGDQGQAREGVQINLRDVWCALDGPSPSRPYVPGAETETEYAGDTGPAVGAMPGWGGEILLGSYDPTTDAGLWYVPKNASCTVAAVTTSLTARGYSADERSILMSGTRDGVGSQHKYRAATIAGLATWRSGRPGGRAGGDGDAYVESSELTWATYPAYRSGWTWSEYIDYVSSSTSRMENTDTRFRYRYGIKTFVNYLLENEPEHNRTSILWQAPEQPLQAVKDALQSMTDVIVGMESIDHMSLEIFATSNNHEVDLTDKLQDVPDRLYGMQAGHYDTSTNIGGGLSEAIQELQSPRARRAAAKVIVLMSDGKPNVDENGRYVGDSAPAARDWAVSQAELARDRGMKVYTIGVGSDADDVLMTEIASLAHGQYFKAEGTPDEYADQLQMIFRTLGGQRPVALIE